MGFRKITAWLLFTLAAAASVTVTDQAVAYLAERDQDSGLMAITIPGKPIGVPGGRRPEEIGGARNRDRHARNTQRGLSKPNSSSYTTNTRTTAAC